MVNITGGVIDAPVDILLELGKLGRWVQAVGLIVIIWIIIQIVNYYFNRKRMRAIEEFQKDINRIEEKIDKLERVISKELRGNKKR